MSGRAERFLCWIGWHSWIWRREYGFTSQQYQCARCSRMKIVSQL